MPRMALHAGLRQGEGSGGASRPGCKAWMHAPTPSAVALHRACAAAGQGTAVRAAPALPSPCLLSSLASSPPLFTAVTCLPVPCCSQVGRHRSGCGLPTGLLRCLHPLRVLPGQHLVHPGGEGCAALCCAVARRALCPRGSNRPLPGGLQAIGMRCQACMPPNPRPSCRPGPLPPQRTARSACRTPPAAASSRRAPAGRRQRRQA